MDANNPGTDTGTGAAAALDPRDINSAYGTALNKRIQGAGVDLRITHEGKDYRVESFTQDGCWLNARAVEGGDLQRLPVTPQHLDNVFEGLFMPPATGIK